MTGLCINVADLLHRPGSRRPVHLEATVRGLENGVARVGESDPVVIDVMLERVPDGIVVHGRIEGQWQAHCSRCLAAVAQPFGLGVRELFETEPLAGETYPLEHETIDLELPVRDLIMLELPIAPHCRDECAGLCPTCGVDRNTTSCNCSGESTDPRWAALRELQL